jgi:hypothetical protein
VLVLADPTALQHIFRGYNYPKRADFRQTIRFLTGTGLLYVDGMWPMHDQTVMGQAS